MSSESAGYMVAMVGGALLAGIAVGVPLAWALAKPVRSVAGARARLALAAIALALLVTAAILWRTGAGMFLLVALVAGLGVGFLVQAARRLRPTAGMGG